MVHNDSIRVRRETRNPFEDEIDSTTIFPETSTYLDILEVSLFTEYAYEKYNKVLMGEHFFLV